MKYITCPNCGKQLLKTSVYYKGTRIEINCPKCKCSLIVYASDIEVRVVEEKTTNI